MTARSSFRSSFRTTGLKTVGVCARHLRIPGTLACPGCSR